MTEGRQEGRRNEVRDTIVVIIEALLIALVFRTFIYQPFSIPTASMQSTMMIGDYFVADKFIWGLGRTRSRSRCRSTAASSARRTQRGDIAVFYNEPSGEDYIKR